MTEDQLKSHCIAWALLLAKGVFMPTLVCTTWLQRYVNKTGKCCKNYVIKYTKQNRMKKFVKAKLRFFITKHSKHMRSRQRQQHDSCLLLKSFVLFCLTFVFCIFSNCACTFKFLFLLWHTLNIYKKVMSLFIIL